MNEAGKTKLLYPKLINQYVTGKVLDIGAGSDPILPNAAVFDRAQGDASKILSYFSEESFDTVFSSHCLEHLPNPRTAIQEWFRLVKRNGHLVIIVPDEDLYEQGNFPSVFNSDHKATFTISKSKSWSPTSVNLLDMANELDGEIMYLAQQSDNYDYSKLTFVKRSASGFSPRNVGRFFNRLPFVILLKKALRRASIDQTRLTDDVLAQICLIIKRSG